MAKASVRLAFYIAEHGNWVDRAIALYTKSKYSHVELVCAGEWYSTSPRDLSVRRKVINPTEGRWDYIDTNVDLARLDSIFINTEGAKYDWVGIVFSQFFHWSRHSKNRWFCSEWVAHVLNIQEPHQYSPEDLYQYMRFKV